MRYVFNVESSNNTNTNVYSHNAEVPASTSLTFRVPDSDNEDEVVSVRSRESSVQVMESNLRTTTYSVPSGSEIDSDSDNSEYDPNDLEKSSPILPPKDKDSAITTPEQQAICVFDDVERPNGKTLDLNLKGPKLREVIAKASGEGSSQSNPIDLDDKNPRDEESNHSVLNPRQDLKQSGSVQEVPMDFDETESEEEGPEVLPIQPTIKRSDIADLLNDKPATNSKASADHESHAGAPLSQSTDTEKSRIERIIRQTQHRVARDEAREGMDECMSFDRSKYLGTVYPAPSVAGTTVAVAGSDDDDNDEDDEEEANKEEKEEEDMDEDFPIDLDEADDFEGAALFDYNAGKSKSTPPTTLSSAEVIDINAPVMKAGLQRAPSPSDAALARDSSNLGPAPRRTGLCPPDLHGATAYTRFADPTTYTWHPTPAVNNDSVWQDIPLPSFTNRHYNAGPFSADAAMASPSSSDPITQRSSSNTRYDHYEYSNGFANCSSMSAEFPTNEEVLSKATEDPSSKLHISNLVNSYYAEPLRSTKRKAAEISADTEESEFSTAHSRLPALSQGTPLPDAQPRDNLTINETSISLGETSEPTISSITTTVATETSQVEEPARKKVKTSSPASGIGKFLIGVGVGAVGFAAAFLATIPASVQEEVRLGL